ncbi:MAG: hypothetical protein N2037_06075 [Acidimicrobiales bacterium]|nr:hypothetical protein [Acidimicrobiales bacterium]
MNDSSVLFVVALGLAVVAALRGAWSPCGQSMISSITPLSEAGRGYRYGSTAAYFVLGALVAGAVVGTGAALLAVVVGRLEVDLSARLGVLAAGALVGAVVDAGFTPWRTPFLCRQVNENWLLQYRSWVYGGGFGFQIGAGVLTYIMTSAVFVTIAAAVLTADAGRALTVMVVFAAVRGSAILLTARVRSFADLQMLHVRFERWREPVRRLTIAGLGLSSAAWVSAAASSPWPGLVVAALALAVTVAARPADAGTDPSLAASHPLSVSPSASPRGLG